MRSKQVDVSAFGYWQTTFECAERQTGGLRAMFDGTDVIGEIAGGFVVLRRDWTLAHPDETKAFVAASAKALDHAREHPKESGLPVERDIQFWIDVLEREGSIEKGKLVTKDILYTTGAGPATN